MHRLRCFGIFSAHYQKQTYILFLPNCSCFKNWYHCVIKRYCNYPMAVHIIPIIPSQDIDCTTTLYKVQGQANQWECQRFAVYEEACRVVKVAYLWHEGWFPCSCTKWWLIIFLFSPLIAVRNPLFYFRNYYRMFSYHKNAPTWRRIIV